MNAARALAKLSTLGVSLVTPADVAAVLEQSPFAASKTLSRLAAEGHVTRIRHGEFWIGRDVDRLRLPELLTEPMPSYVSMQSALHIHGVIEQIPEVVYVATLGRSASVETTIGAFSMHHFTPEVFGGFEESNGAKVATVEKALFDVAYLSAGRDRRFTRLPEVELPRRIRWDELTYWIARTASARQRTIVVTYLRTIFERGGVSARRLVK